MVADGVHILLAVALVSVLLVSDRVEVYLIAVLTGGLPDLDRYLFTPFLYDGYLTGVIWTHRGITHSVLAFALVVGAAAYIGLWQPAAIGYGSHLAADFLTGGIRLWAPFGIRPYGLHYDWLLGNVALGVFAVAVIAVDLVRRCRTASGAEGPAEAPGGWVPESFVGVYRRVHERLR